MSCSWTQRSDSDEAFKTLYLIEAPFDAFATRVDPDQAALMPDQGLLCLHMEI